MSTPLDFACLLSAASRSREPAAQDAGARGSAGDGRKVEPVLGRGLPDRILVRENGVAMEVDLARGQKTGAFLDQRDNRARVRAFSRGKVLNLFSYAGGFSIAAALGGADHVPRSTVRPPPSQRPSGRFRRTASIRRLTPSSAPTCLPF